MKAVVINPDSGLLRSFLPSCISTLPESPFPPPAGSSDVLHAKSKSLAANQSNLSTCSIPHFISQLMSCRLTTKIRIKNMKPYIFLLLSFLSVSHQSHAENFPWFKDKTYDGIFFNQQSHYDSEKKLSAHEPIDLYNEKYAVSVENNDTLFVTIKNPLQYADADNNIPGVQAHFNVHSKKTNRSIPIQVPENADKYNFHVSTNLLDVVFLKNGDWWSGRVDWNSEGEIARQKNLTNLGIFERSKLRNWIGNSLIIESHTNPQQPFVIINTESNEISESNIFDINNEIIPPSTSKIFFNPSGSLSLMVLGEEILIRDNITGKKYASKIFSVKRKFLEDGYNSRGFILPGLTGGVWGSEYDYIVAHSFMGGILHYDLRAGEAKFLRADSLEKVMFIDGKVVGLYGYEQVDSERFVRAAFYDTSSGNLLICDGLPERTSEIKFLGENTAVCYVDRGSLSQIGTWIYRANNKKTTRISSRRVVDDFLLSSKSGMILFADEGKQKAFDLNDETITVVNDFSLPYMGTNQNYDLNLDHLNENLETQLRLNDSFSEQYDAIINDIKKIEKLMNKNGAETVLKDYFDSYGGNLRNDLFHPRSLLLHLLEQDPPEGGYDNFAFSSLSVKLTKNLIDENSIWLMIFTRARQDKLDIQAAGNLADKFLSELKVTDFDAFVNNYGSIVTERLVRAVWEKVR